MKNIKCILLISTCLFLSEECQAEINLTFDVSNTSLSNPTLHTHHTPVELKPISNFNGIKFTSACFLPRCDNSQDYINLDKNKQCEDEGFVKTCPNGEKIKVGNRCPYNNNYGTCCKENCPENSSTTCSGSIIGNDGCGYNCYQCDPCPGYHPCGGTWQYCTGSKCSQDTTRCSNYCVDDYFNNKCDNQADCKGIYRNGYCSGSCEPACVESCSGNTTQENGDGWDVSRCTTCNGKTLYTSTKKSCPAGYSTTVSSCDTSGGYRLVTSGKSGNATCGSCTNSACPTGYLTTVTSCDEGYQLETSGVSGGIACGKCVAKSCPEGYSTAVPTCSSAYSIKSSGKSGNLPCEKCECKLTATSCATGTEATLSCVKDGTTYYRCESCNRAGGSAEGYKRCTGQSYPTNPMECNGTTFYKDCGCKNYDATLYKCPLRGTIVMWYQEGSKRSCEAVVSDPDGGCYEDGILNSFQNCYAYVCRDEKGSFECDANAHLIPSADSFNGYLCDGKSDSGFYPVHTTPILKN